MERNSTSSQGYKIESQIREDYGKAVYEQECHNREIKKLTSRIRNIRITETLISIIAVVCFIVNAVNGSKLYIVIGICSSIILMMLLGLNAYTNGFSLMELSQAHQKASDLLYNIREEYITLITDFERFEIDEIIIKRDKLQCKIYEICKNAPQIDQKSRTDTFKELKAKKDITFTEEEIDKMLPEWIRRSNRNLAKKTAESNIQKTAASTSPAKDISEIQIPEIKIEKPVEKSSDNSGQSQTEIKKEIIVENKEAETTTQENN